MRRGAPGVAGIGFAAQVFQVLALREVLGQVEGSEAVVGVTLGGWLLGCAAGVALGRRAAARTPDPARLLGIAAVAAAALAVAALLAVRFARGWLPLVPGEVPGIGTGLLLAAAGGLVPALGYGFAFPAAARLLDGTGAYAVEAAGALLGGVLFTFVLAPLLPPAGIAALAVALSAAPFLRAAPLPAGVAVAAGLAGLLAGPAVEHGTREAAWSAYLPGHRLLATGQSRYGPLDVLGLRGQASLYRYGHLDFTSPDPEGAALKAHLALCLHPAPRRVLVAGGGPGVVREALLEPLESLVYVDPDPGALTVSGDWIDAGDRDALRDPRVRLLATDPRAAIRDATGAFDVIALFGLEPATAAADRFYTVEFFREAARALAKDGILVLSLRGTGEYRAPDLLRRNAMVLNSASVAMMWSWMIPGEAGYLVCRPWGEISAPSEEISFDPVLLAKRFRDRNIRTPGMTPEQFHLVFPEGEFERTRKALAAAGEDAGGNSDREPAAYHRTLLLRAAEQGARLDPACGGSLAWAVAGAILLAVLALAVFGGPCDASVAGTGFTGMGTFVVVLLGYQSGRGDLYTEVGLLAGLFMAGIAIGSLGEPKRLWWVDFLLFMAVVAGVQFAWRGSWSCFGLSLMAGWCTGATFPAALAAGGDAARLYALDLAGAALGALLAGTLLLPAAGAWALVALFAGVKLAGGAASWFRLRRPPPPASAPGSPG
jgi:spermidine synthase